MVFAEDDQPMMLMDDRSYVAKMNWKKTATKVLIMLQAYKF